MRCRPRRKVSLMRFPSSFAADLRQHGKTFTLQNILSVSRRKAGVYVFYHRNTFVYVGKSQSTAGIQERLVAHYNESHSPELETWIAACNGDMKFTHIPCRDTDVDDLERSLIIYLQPVVNKLRYGGYTPKNAFWRKTHA